MRRVARSSSPLLAVLSLLLLAVSLSLAQPTGAPINPDYIVYLDELARGTWRTVTDDGHGLGDIPDPVMLPAVTPNIELPMAPPATYDLRNTGGKVPAIRNQGACGSCWAFATYASMETCARPTDTADFSENHLKNTHGWDWTCCAGGTPKVSMAYLGRWGGPVYESDDTYNPGSCTSPAVPSARRHMQSARFLPAMTSGTDTVNRDIIQNEIMNHGGVYVNYYSDPTGYYYYKAPAGSTAFYDPSASGTNHGVCIIGWDNNYAATNFLPGSQPPGNGAWLVRNSWGNTWIGNGGSTVGDNGYFWASYYDPQFAKNTVAIFSNCESSTNYTSNYDYDPLGWVRDFDISTQDWSGAVFTKTSPGERVDAVATYATAANTTFEVRVYKNPTSHPSSGTLVSTTTGKTVAYSGYHTIQLSTPVTLEPTDTKFGVAIRYTNASYAYPIPVEYNWLGGPWSGATANPGETYYSADGTSWGDWTSYNATASACLKAFTNPVPTLQWAGTAGYTTDGVDPDSGNPDSDASPTTFTFKVKYTDAAGATPLKANCIISKKECKSWKLHKTIGLTQESGSIVCGAIYSVATTLPNQVYKYRFLFQSGSGTMAVGTPNNYTQGPNITARPKLCWAGTTGYVSDGVEPNSGPTGKFVYKVYYMDSAGDVPTTHEVVLQCDGSPYKTGTMSTYGGDYRLGRIYTKTMWLGNGSHQYRFRFQDSSGIAGGDPATWQSGPSISSSSSGAVTAVAAMPTKTGAQVTFTLSDSADVTATVMNVAGRPVRTIVTDKPFDAGTQTLVWDGKAGSGLAAPAGLYLIRVTARTEEGGQSSAMATLALR